MRILFVAAALAVLVHGNAWAADDEPSASEASSSSAARNKAAPEVTVRARRTQLAPKIRAFVNELTAFSMDDPDRGMAQWTQVSACPLVSGLPKEEAEFILARVSEIARSARVPLAGENCRPNLYILINAEPQELLRGMEKRNRLFTFGNAAPGAVEDFIETSRSVRVWYRTAQMTPEGTPLVAMSIPALDHPNDIPSSDPWTAVSGRPGTSERPGDSAPFAVNGHAQASRLLRNEVWMIFRVFVIVDQTRLQGVSRGQLADYIAMVGLAQIKPGAHLRDAPTILALFDTTPQAARPGMTDWDQAFLNSLYPSEQNHKLQRSEIASGVLRSVAP